MIEDITGAYTFVGWGITERCNLTCPHCYSSAGVKPREGELSTVECMRLIDDLEVLGVRIIGWTGGEPLLRRDLEEIMTYARDKAGIASAITTNGVLLTGKRVDRLRASGVQSIQISIDGSTPERNAIMRGTTTRQFHAIIDSIKLCKQAGMKVHLAMLMGRESIPDALAFVTFAREQQVESVRFCGFVPWGAGKDDDIKARHYYGEDLTAIRKLVEDFQSVEKPVVLFDPAFGPLPPSFWFHECIAGVGTFYISSCGDLYPCTSLLDSQFKVGNIRERRLMELLADPKMTRIAEYKREEIDGPCGDCEYFANCRGACRGVTFAHTGDLNASFPVCLSQTDISLRKSGSE